MKLLVLAALFVLALAVPAWAGFDEGLAAYKRGDYAVALREWRPLAEQGHAQARFKLGVMFNENQGVPRDIAEALKWYRLAAEQGHAEAQYNLGQLYRFGQGDSRDRSSALEWIVRAAEQNLVKAQILLSDLHYHGISAMKDYGLSALWRKRAAEQGHADSYYWLGRLYEEGGHGLTRSERSAASWYEKGAELDSRDCQWALGRLYTAGKDVPRDYGRALKWFTAARVYHQVAKMHYQGLGTPQDYVAAAKYYRLCASTRPCFGVFSPHIRDAKRDAQRDAQLQLGKMYEAGQGVPRDMVQAHTWYSLAGMDGDETAIENRDLVAEKMPPADVSKAQSLAREWLEKHAD